MTRNSVAPSSRTGPVGAAAAAAGPPPDGSSEQPVHAASLPRPVVKTMPSAPRLEKQHMTRSPATTGRV